MGVACAGASVTCTRVEIWRVCPAHLSRPYLSTAQATHFNTPYHELMRPHLPDILQSIDPSLIICRLRHRCIPYYEQSFSVPLTPPPHSQQHLLEFNSRLYRLPTESQIPMMTFFDLFYIC